MLFVIASRACAANLGARLQFEDSSISTRVHVCSHKFRPRRVVTYLCYVLFCRGVHFTDVVWVVDLPLLASLCVSVFVGWLDGWFIRALVGWSVCWFVGLSA